MCIYNAKRLLTSSIWNQRKWGFIARKITRNINFFIFSFMSSIVIHSVWVHSFRFSSTQGRTPFYCNQFNGTLEIDLYLSLNPIPVLEDGKLDSLVLPKRQTINKLEIQFQNWWLILIFSKCVNNLDTKRNFDETSLRSLKFFFKRG